MSIALVAALLAPAATATWYSYGSYEPDNSLDDPTLMWTDDPDLIKNRIYFNAYPTWGRPLANGGAVNPNVGRLGTGIDAPGPSYWEAVLGVWTDCNGDGYIGMLETAVREYRNELLLDKSLCPPVSGSHTQWNGQHNYGPGSNQWVVELIPIGNAASTLGDRRLIKDPEAMIWGDTGKPDDIPTVSTCNVNFARGQTQSTGGLISWADCQGTRGVANTWNLATRDGTGVDTNASNPGNEIVVPGLAPDLAFDDPTRPQDSGSPINRPTFGSEDTQYSPVHMWDCSASDDYVFRSGDLLNETPLGSATQGENGNDPAHNVYLRDLAPTLDDDPTQASVPAFYNETNEHVTQDCDTSNDRGADFYDNVEGDFQGTTIPKIKATWNFLFDNADRGTLPATPLGSGAAGAPTDFGVEALGYACLASGCVQTAWGAESFSTSYTPPLVEPRVRADLADPGNTDVGADISDAAYFTFYASVGSATTDRGYITPGGSGRYGSAQCGTSSSGIHNNWQCDPKKWYILPSGEPTPEPYPLAKPGQRYQFRDVDCFDGRVNGADIGVLPAYYGPNPCT